MLTKITSLIIYMWYDSGMFDFVALKTQKNLDHLLHGYRLKLMCSDLFLVVQVSFFKVVYCCSGEPEDDAGDIQSPGRTLHICG